jgi:hypothetical protein
MTIILYIEIDSYLINYDTNIRAELAEPALLVVSCSCVTLLMIIGRSL